ncbi:MAG: magnesium transporter [Clostridia bacterium]|nr:magnesium transporter [Clostridia bacterium]
MENENKNEELEPILPPEEEEIETPAPTDYPAEILNLIRTVEDDAELRESLGDYHENDIAAAMGEMTPEERERLRGVLGNEAMSEVLAYSEDAGEYLEEMDAGVAADLIEEMDADDAVDVLEDMDEEKREQVLELLEPEAKEDIDLLHSYDDDQFGSIMTTNYVTIKQNMSVKQAMKSLVDQAADNDNISTLYVTDDAGAYCGAIDLKDLIIARQDTKLDSLIVTSYPSVYDTDSIAENLERVRGYSEDSIPVLSSKDGNVIGVITAQDLTEAVKSDLGEDYAKLAGLTDREDMKEPLFRSIRKRIPWLAVLLVLGIVVSTVIGMFEGVFEKIALIVCFQTLILDMAGNVGTQSLAVTIRVISDGTLKFRERVFLVLKEMRVGFFNGAILGAGTFVLIGLYIYFFKEPNWAFAFSTSGCVGVALLVAMAVSSLVGTVTPLFFKRIGVDPAVASGPLITTVNDLVAVCIYYGTAWTLLIRVLAFA